MIVASAIPVIALGLLVLVAGIVLYRRMLLREADPNPATELEHTTPFELLVSVILSAQATDKSVNLATRELYKKANTPAKILALGTAGLILLR